MANVQGFGDLSVFSVGGNSLLTVIKGVEYEVSPTNADTSTISRVGTRRQKVKNTAMLRTATMSTLSGDSGMVASNLAISAFTIGGVDFLSYLKGGSFSGSFTEEDTSGPADAWTWAQIFGKDYSAEVTLMIPAAGDSQTPNFARSLMDEIHDADLNDQDTTRVAFSITIDGVAITVPMIIANVKHVINEKTHQIITLSLEGNDPGTGDYPTAPTGTTSLLEKAFNAYNTALAVVLTPAAGAAGLTYAGNVIFGPFSFSFNNAEIIQIQYEFHNRGAFTATNGS